MATRLDPRADRSHTAALEVARRILVEEGWDALTYARIARQSGLHRATIYRHWPTLTELLQDLLAQEVAITQITPSGDLRTDLLRALTAIRHELIEREFGRVLTALIDRGEWDPALNHIKVSVVREGIATIRQLVEAAAADGTLASGLDPDEAAAFLLGPILYRRLLSAEALTRTFIDHVVDNFLAAHHVSPTSAKTSRRRASNSLLIESAHP